MKSMLISSLFFTAGVCVLMTSGAPMGRTRHSHRRPRLTTKTADRLQETSTSLFDAIPDDLITSIAEHLTAKESAQLTTVSSKYRKLIEKSPNRPELHFGSEEAFVENVKHCKWLKKNPEKKKKIQSIYVTSEVFMECQFIPNEYPHLKNVNIKLMMNTQSDRPSGNDYNLLEDQGFIDIKNGEWNNGYGLNLNIYSRDCERVFNCLESKVIQENNAAEWLEFLLKHRVWESLDDPFAFWENLVHVAVLNSDEPSISTLFEFAKQRPYLRRREPFAVEEAVTEGPEKYDMLREYVDNGFLDALLAVESGYHQVIGTWLSGQPTTDQVCRVLNHYLQFKEPPGMNGYNGEIVRLLANDARLDPKYRDHKGISLIFNAARRSHWEALGVLLSRGAIDLNNPEDAYDGILQFGLVLGMPFEQFQSILDLGVNTFGKNDCEWSPLVVAVEEGKRQFFEAIVAKRLNENTEGVLELQLSAMEKEYFDGFEEARQWIGDYPIRIVTP